MNAPHRHAKRTEAPLTPEEALARFRAQWPVERTRALAWLECGTPAEREAAMFRLAQRAMEKTETQGPADDAVRALVGRLA